MARFTSDDTNEGVEGEIAALIRSLGIRSDVGAPVVADGRVWGALIAGELYLHHDAALCRLDPPPERLLSLSPCWNVGVYCEVCSVASRTGAEITRRGSRIR